MNLDRRSLLVAGGAGVGLVVAWSLWPRRTGSALVARKGEAVLGPYLKVATDGRITVAIPQAETGQGIWTGLAQIAADELGAAWEQVAVEPAPAAPGYANALFGSRITASASSIRAFEAPLRQAAATARDLLVRAAADQWNVPPEQCETEGGFVTHGGDRLPFGAVAVAAARLDPAADAPLRPAGSRRLAGRALPRLDAPPKVDGSWRFAGDVRLPGMLFASARLAPPRGRIGGFDRAAAGRAPGHRAIVDTDQWVAAVADHWWGAEQALLAAKVRFEGPTVDAGAIERILAEGLESGEGQTLFERGDFHAALGGRRALAATYRIAPAPHRALEPPTATARFAAGRLEVWAPVQAYDSALALAARSGGVAAADVVLYPMPVGDPSGRALEAEAIPIAIALARRFDRPVQLTLPPRVGHNHDPVRPPLLARMLAVPPDGGAVTGWSARFVSAPGLEATLARLANANRAAPLRLPGATPPYGVPAMRVAAVAADLPIRCGYLRGGSEALTAFANECWVDELARAAGAEPFSFRMGLLGGQPRLARTLQAATLLGQWDGGGAGSRLGLACAAAWGSFIALLAEASIGPDQRIAVTRLVATVDCGRAVNPDLVRQQVEGSLLQALALATAPAPEFVAGMPVARSSGEGGRVFDVPRVTVELVPSSAEPGGVSGLGHLVLAPAVANAIAAGTGRRLRNLPFDPMGA